MADEVVSIIDDSIHSIIGEGTRLCGDFEVKGLLRIDGDFSGSIRTNGKVLVSKKGRAECSIDGNIVVIGGIVRGTIVARHSVEILGSGVVIGTVIAPRLIVHEHVLLQGMCRVTKDAECFRNAVRLVEEQLALKNGRGRPASLPAETETETEKVRERIAQ
ncbi:MAG: polymer-forming cytoskeletal protein [Spirochaetales bacterium]|nr:polymer-forming cytoskeletal protein [Spirochaetales bacterium]